MILSLAGNQLFSKTSYAHLSLNSIQPHFFHAKDFFKSISFCNRGFEWAHGVVMLVAMLSGCVCVCVFNHDACPLSVFETTFYGHKYTSQVTAWQPREEQPSTIMYPPSSVLNHQEKIALYFQSWALGWKQKFSWPTEQPQNHTAKYTGARADIEPWLISSSVV